MLNSINSLLNGQPLKLYYSKKSMNAPICTNCYEKYTQSNPARTLIRCSHIFCTKCILNLKACPVDNYPLELPRYKLQSFRINAAVMRDTKKQPIVRRSTKGPVLGITTTKEQDPNMCLLHDKPLDVVCIDHLKKICSSCALFGDHKLHKVECVQKVIADCSVVGEHALNTLTEVMAKDEQISEEAVLTLVNSQLKEKRDILAKNIRGRFKKLADHIRKLEVQTVKKLEQIVEMQREQLVSEIKVDDIIGKKTSWMDQAKKLIDLVEKLTNDKYVEEAARYVNDSCVESTISHRGEYLLIEISSFEMNLANKLEKYKEDILLEFDERLEEKLQNFVFIGRETDKDQKPAVTEEKKVLPEGDEFLLQEAVIKEKKEQVQTPQTCETMYPSTQFSVLEIQPFTLTTQYQPEVTEVRQVQENSVLSGKESQSMSVSLNDLRKKKKIKVPEKYQITIQDLRNDRCQTIDLGGAELGDAIIIQLCDYVRYSKKLRCLKLVRNKLTNDSLQAIIEACTDSNVTSLNLGQNLMTDSALDILEKLPLRELKAITLSQNKLKQRTCKQKLIEFKKKGVTLSI